MKPMLKRTLLSTLVIGLMATQAFAHEGDHPAPAAAPISGIDTQYIDSSVRAQDDFFTHLNGGWLKATKIPDDKASWGSFAKLRDDTLPQLRGLIEETQKTKHKQGSEAQKIADLYTSYMNEAALEKLGTKPLAGELSAIRGLKDKKALPGMIAHLTRIGVSVPYGVYISQDARNSTQHAASIAQSGLGLPDRDYYLKKDDAKLAAVRDKYVAHIANTLNMAGHKNAAASAQAIMALETALAEVQWTKVDNRDPVKRYNKTEIAKLAELAPGYDWKDAMGKAGIATKTDTIIVNQPSYLAGFAKIVEATELDTWKAYFEWQLLRDASPYLNKAFADADFAFYSGVINGVTVQEPRWKSGVRVVEGAIGEGLGKLYVAQYFPADRKARMEALVKNLMAAYKDSIDTLDWMSPETKREAQAKLAKFTTKIGYPNKWRDYSALTVVSSDLAGNMRRAAEFAYKRNLAKLGAPVDLSLIHI